MYSSISRHVIIPVIQLSIFLPRTFLVNSVLFFLVKGIDLSIIHLQLQVERMKKSKLDSYIVT